MRWLFLVISFFVSGIFTNANKEVVEMEKDIYELYKSDFIDYLKMDEDKLVIDIERLKEYFKDKKYEVEFRDSDNLVFKVSINRIIKYEKEYYFYLVSNNENN